MPATITKTSKKITEKVTTKKEASKLSYYQKKKAIDEIAQSINRNITRRNLMKIILEE
ncbi:hypothetical protein [Capnocytophaga bilenii]|jgi:hypothetical protein|uniref:hypothetical protein n=1 Tax=Capnocytophaga bilenii TaxID=2819369 RepID=UPI0028D0485E|nr:hypothetical protein [Capnocytophaga bilenii]